MDRNFIAGLQCPLCGSGGQKTESVDGYPLRVCCGSQLSWQWPDVDDYYAMYSSPTAYAVDEQIRANSAPMSQRHDEFMRASEARLAIFTAHYGVERRTSLDVGAGTGAFVECAHRKHGWAASGVEPCGDMVRASKERGLTMYEGGWQAACGIYDTISLHDVWEHLVSPLSCLDHLRSCLAENGVLIIEIPEWDGPDQRASGWAWRHIRPRQHIFLPSRTAAESMFEAAGLRVDAFYRPLGGLIGKCCWYLRKEK